jgi:hypothetical protein
MRATHTRTGLAQRGTAAHERQGDALLGPRTHAPLDHGGNQLIRDANLRPVRVQRAHVAVAPHAQQHKVEHREAVRLDHKLFE